MDQKRGNHKGISSAILCVGLVWFPLLWGFVLFLLLPGADQMTPFPGAWKLLNSLLDHFILFQNHSD